LRLRKCGSRRRWSRMPRMRLRASAESQRQTDAKIVHRPLVIRGKDGHGAPTLQCQTCHQKTNTADGFVPGVATWHLAPLSMLWEGRTKRQICEQMKDRARNGGTSRRQRSHRAHEGGSARDLGMDSRCRPHDPAALARKVRGGVGGMDRRGHAVPGELERLSPTKLSRFFSFHRVFRIDSRCAEQPA
jgi:hypothetical protein